MTKNYTMNNSALQRPDPDIAFSSVEELIAATRPSRPLYVLWPERIASAAK